MMFRHLEAFIETARAGSVTQAAETLLLTQPTVSGQLKELEEELGVALFNRMPRGVELTEAGKRFLPRAREILVARRKLLDEASEYKGLLSGILEIHASNIPGEYLLPPCLALFKKKNQGLRIVLRIHDSRETIGRILCGDAALGIVGGDNEDPDLEFHPLWEDKIFLYAKADSALPDNISFDELGGVPLLMREEGSATRRAVEKALMQAGLSLPSLSVAAELGSTTAVKNAIGAGIGAAFLSEVAAASECERGVFRRVGVSGFGPIKRRFFLVRHKRRELSPASRAFCEFALASAAGRFS